MENTNKPDQATMRPDCVSQTHGQTDRWTDGPMDQWINGWTLLYAGTSKNGRGWLVGDLRWIDVL